MSSEFYRLKRLPPYLFAEVNGMKAKARAAGEDIIDLGMGNPDTATPKHIVDKMIEAVQDPKTHRYSSSRGIPGLRRAIAAYYQRRFGVKIDPEKEAVVTLGSKEGLVNLAQAITEPGDVILVPSPTYPIHTYAFMIAGAAIRQLPFTPEHSEADLLAALERAVRHSVPKPLALVLCFPANPTARTCGLDFYSQVVEFAKRHGIYVISDLAYSELYFDGIAPPSILEVPGAKDVAIEIQSFSKTYSMAGWRMGYAVGNPKLVGALAHVKSYVDYGAFTPIQVAATAALNGPQDCVDELRRIYRERRDVLVKGLEAAGWEIPSPAASMFAWAPLPAAFRHLGSNEFAKLLLKEAKVAVSPGIGFGEYGEGYVRIAMVENVHRIRQAVRNIKAFFASAGVNSVQRLPARKRAASS
ncbi:MAG: LL-diaminopimelate aminotransferase [Candidatus Odyssella sp.]|nr:LL-diaminopimelate aminotransferase [Candidatus Odyssella sp.]